MTEPRDEDLLSMRRAARVLGIREATLRLAVHRGEIEGVKLGKRTIRVELGEARAWMRRHRLAPRGLHA